MPNFHRRDFLTGAAAIAAGMTAGLVETRREGHAYDDAGPNAKKVKEELKKFQGKWKLVARHKKEWELYDLAADRTELTNVAAEHADTVNVIDVATIG